MALKANKGNKDEGDIEEAAEEVAEEVSEAKSTKQQPKSQEIASAAIKKSNKDFVEFCFLVDMNPPPIIGFYNMAIELTLKSVKPQQRVKIPRHVAEVLVDSHKGIILE